MPNSTNLELRNLTKYKQVKDFLKKESKGTTKQYQTLLKKGLENFSKNPNNNISTILDLTKREYKDKRDYRIKPVVRKNRQVKDKEGKRIWIDVRIGKRIKGKAVQKIIKRSIVVKLENMISQKRRKGLKEAKQFLKKQRKRKSFYKIFKMFYQ